MSKLWRLVCAAVAGALVLTLLGAAPASAGAAQGGVVGAVPDDRTPHVLDGTVLDIEQVGDRIVVAGTFTRVQDAATNGGAEWAQAYVFAFDAATGAIDRAFDPQVSGVVRTVLRGPAGSVFLGGTFFTLNGQDSRNLVNVSLATGLRTAFRAPAFNGAINDLAVAGDRLFVAGIFTTVGGVSHRGLATLTAATGALDAYMGVDVLENHNYPRGSARASVGVSKIDISPDGSRMAAIGNFRSAEGLARDQAMTILLQSGGAVVDPNWRTRRYEPACNANSFDTYVRDVEFSPDGSFFSIVTTGGGYSGTLCDTATRWDSAATGQDVQPRWVAVTGGDTLLSVAVTDTAVYVGGHQRWMNNPLGRDAARAGAVPRPGISALDVRTGMPLAWNPGRNPRDVGAEALLATADGLYVGMDTEYFGDYRYRRARLGFFPLAGGGALPSEDAGQLPANVVLAGRLSSSPGVDVNDVRTRFFDGTAAGADAALATGSTEWSRARGAFRVGDTVYYGYPAPAGGYSLFRRSFDGTTLGTPSLVDPYNDPEWSDVVWENKSGTTGTYRGALPTFYSQLSSVTAMAYRDGRLYYTLSSSSSLFYRYFSLDSGTVSEDVFTAATSGFGSVSGLVISGDQVYLASSSTGELRRMSFVNGTPSGTPTTVSGPARDGRDWRARALFLSPRPNQAPTATFTATCLALSCTFDARGSSDTDGRIAAYQWELGDGSTATGATVTKAYDTAATRTVLLRVTDDDGASSTTTRSVATEAPAPDAIAVRGATGGSARGVTQAAVTVPAAVRAGDGLVLLLSTNSVAKGATPAGWTLAGTQTSGTSVTTQVFSRVAAAADAGSRVAVTLDRQASVTLQLAAYSGTDATAPVTSVTGVGLASSTSHTTPRTTAAEGSYVLSAWSDKQAVARTWVAPGAVTVRSNLRGTGNGDVATLVADSGAPVPAGPVGGLTATVPTASNRATALTVVLAPRGSNLPPEAAFGSTCTGLDCRFDAGSSADRDGEITGYAWSFGDGTTGSGRTADHRYTTAGDYTVTLTVTDDDGGTSSSTATVPVAATPPAQGIGLRGSAGAATNTVTSASVTVPADVRAGDGLLLVLSTNSTATGATPAGYRQEASLTAAGTSPTTQVFSRVAGATDAGSRVTVPLSASAKVTLQLLAYSGTAATGPVASATGAASPSGTAHTTPRVDVAAAGSWVVSIWSDKQAGARTWTPPSSVTARSNVGGVGNGDVATLIADSGAPVPAGSAGGLTATVPTASNRAVTFTVVLAPAG
jgi:PKD repeat protein